MRSKKRFLLVIPSLLLLISSGILININLNMTFAQMSCGPYGYYCDPTHCWGEAQSMCYWECGEAGCFRPQPKGSRCGSCQCYSDWKILCNDESWFMYYCWEFDLFQCAYID